MQQFTGYEYIQIDIANNFGLDKLLFNERIDWVNKNLSNLEELAGEAEEKPLYIKAVSALRKAQQGIPTGHLVGFDGVCSGVQIMSAVTGCLAGATATGLIDPNVRADAYTATTDAMSMVLGPDFAVSRGDAKQALMTSFYGSRKTPKTIFGEDTPELAAFYQAAETIAPGAWRLLQILLASWNPDALSHDWKLPDGYDAHVKVMDKVEMRIEVDELDHATFSYEYYENLPMKRGLSNVANVTHSLDAYVVRSVQRRCNYNRDTVTFTNTLLEQTLQLRKLHGVGQDESPQGTRLHYYIDLYNQSQLADVVILPHLTEENVYQLSTSHIEKLIEITTEMLSYKPFAVVTIHDEFKCHPNYMNHLRQQYANILADMADSQVLSSILNQLFNDPTGKWEALSPQLGDKIRQSNYALC